MPNFRARGQAAAPRLPIARCAGAALLGLMLSACGPQEDAASLSEPTVDKELTIVLKQTGQPGKQRGDVCVAAGGHRFGELVAVHGRIVFDLHRTAQEIVQRADLHAALVDGGGNRERRALAGYRRISFKRHNDVFVADQALAVPADAAAACR